MDHLKNTLKVKMRDFFTKKRFLSLPPEQQHKKCAEHLRKMYDVKLQGREDKSLQDHLALLCEWTNSAIPDTDNLKSLSDAYHTHLNLTRQSLKEHNLLQTIRKGDLKEPKAPFPIAIYLDHIRSAHNVGSILRTTEAFCLGHLYFSPSTPFVDNKQVKDTAMGTDAWVSAHQAHSIEELPRPLIALETSDLAISLHEFIFPETFTLVLGNEEYGCSDEILQQADFLVEIPLTGRKNSLNVANAFAITAAEIIRQKGTKNGI